MDKQKNTSEKSQDDHQSGGLFLCPELSIPAFVIKLVTSMDDLRTESQVAKEELLSLQIGWQATEAAGVWQSYGKTLERFVAVDPDFDPFVARTIRRMERLYDRASAYNDACSVVRSVAVDVSRILRSNRSDETPFCYGSNYYGLVDGPFKQNYLAHYDFDRESVALFDCETETNKSNHRLAGMEDYQALLLDALTEGTILTR